MRRFLDRIRNSLIREGKKRQAWKKVLEVEERLQESGYSLGQVEEFFLSLCPKIRLVDRKKGASTYKLPTLITSAQSQSLAMKWFLRSLRERKERRLEDRLFQELKESLDGKSRTLKRKEEYYKLAIHNRGFLRFLRKKRR